MQLENTQCQEDFSMLQDKNSQNYIDRKFFNILKIL